VSISRSWWDTGTCGCSSPLWSSSLNLIQGRLSQTSMTSWLRSVENVFIYRPMNLGLTTAWRKASDSWYSDVSGYSTVLYSVGSCAPTQRSWTITDVILHLHLHCRSIKFAPVSVWFPVSRLSLQLFCLPSLMLQSLHLIEVESIIAKKKKTGLKLSARLRSLSKPVNEWITNHSYPCTMYIHTLNTLIDVLNTTFYFRNILFKIHIR